MPRPFPTEAVRDALGLVRLLYAARKTREAVLPDATDPLVAIGRELTAALELAHCEEGSLGYRAALDRVARALIRLNDEITIGDNLSRLAQVSRSRVAGEPFMIAGRAIRERR